MSRRAFDAEITLDLAVNVLPFLIMAFFVGVFAVFNPWGVDPLQSAIQFSILFATMGALALATYLAARAIETDDRTHRDASDS